MAPPKKLNPCTATLDILVPCDLKERVKVLAARDGRTVSNYVRLLLERETDKAGIPAVTQAIAAAQASGATVEELVL